MLKKIIRILIPVLLLIGVIYHIGIGADRIVFDIRESYRTIGQHALWRGMRFHRSESLANNIWFLNQVLPEDAVVMLPSQNTTPKTLSVFPSMQFFLDLRELIPCKDTYKNCIKRYESENVYILLAGNQTELLQELGISKNRLVMQDDTLGVIFPSGMAVTSTSTIRSFSSRLEIVYLLILPACFLLLLLLPGFFVFCAFLPEETMFFKLACGYGLSLGSFSFLIYCVLLLNGGLLTAQVIWLSLLALYILAGILLFFQIRGNGFHLSAIKIKWQFDIWLAILLIYLLVQIGISVGRAYSSSDDIDIWGVKGYSISKYGLSDGLQEWGTKTTKYTLNNPILIAVFRVLFSESAPESKLISPVFAFMLYLLMYDHLKQKIPGSIAGLSTFFVATVPILYRHANKAYANIIVSYYCLAVFILLLKVFENKGSNHKKYIHFIAPFLILAAWSRPEAVIIGGVLLVYIVIIIRKEFSQSGQQYSMSGVIAPYGLFLVFWGLSSNMVYANSVKDSGLFHQFIKQLLNGNIYIDRFGQIFARLFYYYFNPDNWGALGIMILVLVLLVYVRGKALKQTQQRIGFGLIYIFMVAAVYYSTLFVDGPSLNWWLSTGLTRMIMPGMITLWLAAFSSLYSIE